ncbi:hypothetical protein DOA20_26460 [Salmonella enterica subsp. enterica serovar Newport]|nr:hypothetical protein [Salmonella enterica subsp. enterica serovar Newport]
MINTVQPVSLTGLNFKKECNMSAKNISILAALILFAQSVCYAKDFSLEFVRHVFLNLDVTSFPSSMGPKHFPGGTTMKETFKYFGIPEVSSDKNTVTIFFPDNPSDVDYKNSGWEYTLRILSVDKNKKITACYTDICHGECTYAVTQPVSIEKRKSKYIVTQAYDKSIDGCEYFSQ